MPNIIQLLPESVANQIAAGEVIQRPASVIKELLENSIDAKATKVQLIIEDYGKQLIQVIDNGVGMSEIDARMSLERHATSKIREAKDLESLRSFGFRGEALASIVSIANVQLKTRTADQKMGLSLTINGSKIDNQEYCQCPQGTNIAVRHLFYNVPARRKFLKSDSVELKHILDEFHHVALVHTDIEFTLHHNQKEIHLLKPSTLRQRIISIYGKNYNDKLVPVEEVTDNMKVHGFIGKPELAKSRRGLQMLFLNDRYIHSNYLNHAIKRAYMQLIPDGHSPFFVIKLELDPSFYDINVHPTKQEVRFDNDKLIYDLLHVSCKHALGRNSISPPLDFSGSSENADVLSPSSGHRSAHNPVIIQSSNFSKGSNKRDTKAWGDLYADLSVSKSDTTSMPQNQDVTVVSSELLEEVHFETISVYGKYIAAQGALGFILVNARYAHARVIYEKLKKNNTSGEQQTLHSQTLLFPQTIEFTKAEHGLLMEHTDIFRQLGFDLNDFGSQSVLVHAVPNILPNELDLKELLIDFIQSIEKREDLEAQLIDNLYKKLATQSARQFSTSQSSSAEQRKLLNDLFNCEFPHVSPLGQKTFVTFDEEDIDKLF